MVNTVKDLGWNSRTPIEEIEKTSTFIEIVDFIRKPFQEKWIIGFLGHSQEESSDFQEKLCKLLRNTCLPETDYPIHQLKLDVSSPQSMLDELASIPPNRAGVVFIDEPLSYGSLQFHNEYICKIHGEIIKNASLRPGMKVFMFGNAPYMVNYLNQNSPILKYIFQMFRLSPYKKNELQVLNHLEEAVRNKLIQRIGGNHVLARGLEYFWSLIHLEECMQELVGSFLEVPVGNHIKQLVDKELNHLRHFIQINYMNGGNDCLDIENDNSRIWIKSDLVLLKNHFEKTSLFAISTKKRNIAPFWVVEPKPEFAGMIDVKCFGQEPLPISVLDDQKELAGIIDPIAALFDGQVPVFFLGAGNSLASGAPDRRKLFVDILGQVYPDRAAEWSALAYQELTERFADVMKKMGAGDIRKRVIRFLAGCHPGAGHFYLSMLAKHGLVKTLITTNFDSLVEDALMDYGLRSRNFLKLVAEADCPTDEWTWLNEEPYRSMVKLFKICGDIHAGPWLAVEDDTAARSIQCAVFALEGVDEFRNASFFIILGHKFEVVSLSRILSANPPKKTSDRPVVVYVNPDERDCAAFQTHYCAFANITTVSGELGEFDHFMQALCENLRSRNRF